MTRMDPRIAARRMSVQEGRARRSLKRLIILLAVVALLGAGWWLIRSPLFSVATISVSGATEAPVAALVEEAGAGVGTPLIGVDTGAVEQALEGDRWVIEATVGRRWPSTMSVSIRERVPVVRIQTTTEVLTVAVDGTVLERAEVADGSAFPVIDARALEVGAPAEDPVMVGAIGFLAALGPEMGLGAQGYFGPEGMVARVAGFDVRVGGPDQPEEKAAAVKSILATRPAEGSIITVVAPERPAILDPEAQVAPDVPDEGEGDDASGEGDDTDGTTDDSEPSSGG